MHASVHAHSGDNVARAYLINIDCLSAHFHINGARTQPASRGRQKELYNALLWCASSRGFAFDNKLFRWQADGVYMPPHWMVIRFDGCSVQRLIIMLPTLASGQRSLAGIIMSSEIYRDTYKTLTVRDER